MGAIRRCALGTVTMLSATVLAATLLVACTQAPADTSPQPTSTKTPTSSQDPDPTPPADPEFVPEGSAEDNLPYFDFVNSAFLSGGNPGGRAIIDNLVAAGFAKEAMEVTADRTPLGSDVDSLQFSVRIGEECLIGQAGAAGYAATVAPALATGSCLVGKTRAIDW
jgi:hypothetical protein